MAADDFMAIPIVTMGHVPEQGLLGMRFTGEMPTDPHVLAKTHEENTFAFLRDAIIGGIEDLRDYAVVQAITATAGMMLLKSDKVVGPGFPLASGDFRMFELQANVFVIISKARSGKPLDVLKNEGLGTSLPHRPDGFWKHVAGIAVSSMPPSQGKRLTRGAAGNEVDFSFVLTEIKGPDIPFQQVPILDRLDTTLLVLADRIAAIAIPLDHADRLKPRSVKPNPKPSGSDE